MRVPEGHRRPEAEGRARRLTGTLGVPALGKPRGDRSLPAPQLYESALTENQKLKAQLQEAQLQLADVQSRLEKAAQVRGAGAGKGDAREGWPPRRRAVGLWVLSGPQGQPAFNWSGEWPVP